LRTIFAYLGGLVWAALLGNFVYDLLGWLGGGERPSLISLWVCIGAVGLLIILSIVVKIPQPPLSPSEPEEVEPPRMKGLIMLLSFYSPRGKPLSSEEFKALLSNPIQTLDKDRALSFEQFVDLLSKESKTLDDWKRLEEAAKNSNFDVPLQAIRHHLKDGSLCHVWLICTDDASDRQGNIVMDDKGRPKSPGSYRVAPYLEKFIHEASHRDLVESAGLDFTQASKVRFHYHHDKNPKPNCLVNYFGEQGTRDVFRTVNYIFDEEVELTGLEPNQVICDFTGARATHTVGMVLACLPAARRIQYTSSPQAATGDYLGRPRPREVRADTSWVARLVTLEDLLRRWEETRE
jgi:hypothetical protein